MKKKIRIDMETSGINPDTNKVRIVHNSLISKMMKRIPLEIRMKVTNEMMIQSYLIDAGYIPDGFWNDEKEKKYGKSFRKFAKELTEAQIKKFEEWEKDGRPHYKNK